VLRIKIIVVDRTRSSFLAEGESLYLDRIRKYAGVEWIETKPAKIKKGRPSKSILDTERDAIRRKLHDHDYVIALDPSGKVFSSEGFAAWIDHLSVSRSRLTFVVGGPLGLAKEILDRSQERLSLSRLTFTHEMSRIILLEQLYRAFTIINHEKYHK